MPTVMTGKLSKLKRDGSTFGILISSPHGHPTAQTGQGCASSHEREKEREITCTKERKPAMYEMVEECWERNKIDRLSLS